MTHRTWSRNLALVAAALVAGLGGSNALSTPAPRALNPTLSAEVWTGGDDPEQQPLKVGDLDIAVAIEGATARTTVTARFDNPGDDDLEGEFILDLPAGSVVTGYGLDVDGEIRPGVLAGRRQAVLAYENRVRRGVDPGIAEPGRGNAFRTKVYPIRRGGNRTVRLEFVTPLADGAPYVLPLVTGDEAGAVRISVAGQALKAAPKVTGPDGAPLPAVGGDGLKLAGGWTAKALNGALVIDQVAPATPMLVSKHSSGETFFDIVDTAPMAAAAPPPRSVRIYWDRSLSRRTDDLKAEIALARAYLERTGARRIELVSFASDTPRRQILRSPAELEAALEGLTYRGATSPAGVLDGSEPAADVCLLFSDGRMTLDAWKSQPQPCALSTITTSADADTAKLQTLARNNGGAFVDLGASSQDQALAALTQPRTPITDVTRLDGTPVPFMVADDRPGHLRVIGLIEKPSPLVVHLGDRERRYSAQGQPLVSDAVGALWGARALAEADTSDHPDLEAMVGVARRYSVASPAASFVVLESMDDYADAGVAPPAMVGEDDLAEYKELVAERRQEDADSRRDRLETVLEAWNEQKQWWRYDFRPGARNAGADKPDRTTSGGGGYYGGGGGDDDGTSVASVVVTASRAAPVTPTVPVDPSKSRILVEVQPWNPDRPYLKALAAAPGRFEAVFGEQEAQYGDNPAFYLDVAEYLFRQGRKAEAVQMALSALEASSTNGNTQFVVAGRMIRYGDDARGLWLYEHVMYLAPDLPQPRRALALALVEAADRPGVIDGVRKARYRRAMDLLTEVIMTPWDGAYDGIEMVSLTEANALVEPLEAMGVDDIPLDRRLRALLPVDIRVTLEWNTAATDMDLWVEEPTGETAIYSNPQTDIGGRLSNDMTSGYGPEEYLLRRAPGGEYRIKANVYATDTLDPNGATTITARLYRDWGRPTQKMETLEIDLTPDKTGGDPDGEAAVLVGKFRVAGRPRAETPPALP